MTIDTNVPVNDETRIPAQWAGVLLAPVAWLLDLELAYMAADHACRDGGPMALVHLAHAGTLLLALTGGAIAWREWRRWGARHADEQAGREARSRFMTVLGLLVSTLLAMVIVAQWIPSFIFHPCQ